MGKILKRSSFGLLRTNPKLTTNVKLVADSREGIFLESIDANVQLSRSVYKGFRLNPGGSYAYDLTKFYSQGGSLLPKDLAYYVFERDSSTEVKDRYKGQYDFTYAAGAYVKNSRIYPEEYAVFAPLWIEAESVPDRFVIFKMEGPVSADISGYPDDVNRDTAQALDALVSDPTAFWENYVKHARIVKSFDLTAGSSLGKYLRAHVQAIEFPESPLYMSLRRGAHSHWQGISYDKGGFCAVPDDVYSEYTLVDKTIIEADDFITAGFQRNGVVCANVINLEFLFDDPDREDYKFSRYFGLYCSEAEVGRFVLSGDRLYDDRDRETMQVPRPTRNLVAHPWNVSDQVQANALGVKVYPDVVATGASGSEVLSGRLVRWDETQVPRFPYVEDVNGRLYSIDATNGWQSAYTVSDGSIEVRALSQASNIAVNYPAALGTYVPGTAVNGHSAWYLLGSTGGTANALYFETSTTVAPQAPDWVLFHQGVYLLYGLYDAEAPPVPWDTIFYGAGGTATVHQFAPGFVTDDGYLRLKDKRVNWKDFTGFAGPFSSVDGKLSVVPGTPAFSFKVLDNPESGDSLRIRYLDPDDPNTGGMVDAFTIMGDVALPEAQSNGLLFSVNGTNQSVAQAMAKAVNFVPTIMGDLQPFEAIAIGDEVVVFARVQSDTWNRLRYSLFSTGPTFPFDPFNDFSPVVGVTAYRTSPVSYGGLASGLYYEDTFRGGNNNPYARLVVERSAAPEFVATSDEPLFVKTTQGFCEVEGYAPYLDEPQRDGRGRITGFRNYDKYFVVSLTDRSQSFDIGPTKRASFFRYATNGNGFLSIFPVRDFDFDFRSTCYTRDADSSPLSLHSWFVAGGSTGATTLFDYSALNTQSAALVATAFSSSSPFVQNGGFQGLAGVPDEFTDTVPSVFNEYDRLKENSLAALALTSRVVPFINKWVYDNWSTDVRENGYRLNVDQAFTYSNFSPSFDQTDRSHKFHTHEWYYLQRYPPYMDFYDKARSFSYFDDNIYFPRLPLSDDPAFSLVVPGLTGGTGATANLYSVAEDYFTAYFTRETVDGVPIPRDFKYAVLAYGSPTKHAECLFRGAKVEVRERSDSTHMEWNKASLRFLPSEIYNGYRFSAVLALSESGSQITVVKNDKWKAVTMVVEAELGGPMLGYTDQAGATHYFIDRASLYALDHKLAIAGETASFADIRLSGGIAGWVDDGINFVVQGGTSLLGTLPNFSEEMSLNQNGGYNPVRVTGATYSFTFEGIHQVTTGGFKCRRIYSTTFDSSPITPNGSNSLYPDVFYGMWAGVYWLRDGYVYDMRDTVEYLGGGYNAYAKLIDSVSFAQIAHSINLGDPRVRYVNVTAGGSVEFDTFCLELVKPDYVPKATYARVEKIRDRPVDLQNSTQTLGYELRPMPRTQVSELARARGGYSPKFVDILEFVDTADAKADGLDYMNVEVYTGGTAFGRPFASLRNLYFNKVNVENPNIILRAESASNDKSIFPDIGEIAIDYADHFVFRSNWDPFYYRRYPKKDLSLPVLGTREPKEQRAFFGSKIMFVPDLVRIEKFEEGFVTSTELGNIRQIGTVPQNLVVDTVPSGRGDTLEASVIVSMALEDWLIRDGFGAEFERYVHPSYSFGSRGLSDDIKIYIRENILERYYVQEVLFFEKVLKKGETSPQFVTGLSDAEKQRAGYVRSKNFGVKPFTQDGLDFKLIHTLPVDRRTSVAVSVVLAKK